MTDLTNPNMLKLRDMSAEERRAIEAAWWDGKTVEQFCGSEWCKKDSNVFSGRVIYRVAETQPTPMQVPGDALQDWIQHVTVNENGAFCGHNRKPTAHQAVAAWCSGGRVRLLTCVKIERGTVPWHQSLVTRPGTKA